MDVHLKTNQEGKYIALHRKNSILVVSFLNQKAREEPTVNIEWELPRFNSDKDEIIDCVLMKNYVLVLTVQSELLILRIDPEEKSLILLLRELNLNGIYEEFEKRRKGSLSINENILMISLSEPPCIHFFKIEEIKAKSPFKPKVLLVPLAKADLSFSDIEKRRLVSSALVKYGSNLILAWNTQRIDEDQSQSETEEQHGDNKKKTPFNSLTLFAFKKKENTIEDVGDLKLPEKLENQEFSKIVSIGGFLYTITTDVDNTCLLIRIGFN